MRLLNKEVELTYSEVAFCSLVLAFAVSVRKLESEAQNLTTSLFSLVFLSVEKKLQAFRRKRENWPKR